MKKVIVIGGGASGMMAAIIAARNHAEVTILEHKERIGKKILMTGNGKCNLSNLSFSDEFYNSDDSNLYPKILREFDVQDTIQFFHEIGLLTKEKRGYIYPMSEQASTVLDILRLEIRRLNIKVITEVNVIDLYKKNDIFYIKTKEEQKYQANSVIIACGGKASPQTGSDGSGYILAKKLNHHIIKPLPALVQLRCKEPYMKQVAGVRCDANLSVYINNEFIKKESGELQLTDYGISGIPVFQLSRIASKAIDQNRNVVVEIDLLPSMNNKEIEQFMIQNCLNKDDCTVEEALLGILNKKLLQLILKMSGIKPNVSFHTVMNKKSNVEKLIYSIKNWRVQIEKTNPFQNAQVCCGGVDCREITEKMESKMHKNLFFCGEILDVDGICGGYNLQWAWSSGYVAGKNAAT